MGEKYPATQGFLRSTLFFQLNNEEMSMFRAIYPTAGVVCGVASLACFAACGIIAFRGNKVVLPPCCPNPLQGWSVGNGPSIPGVNQTACASFNSTSLHNLCDLPTEELKMSLGFGSLCMLAGFILGGIGVWCIQASRNAPSIQYRKVESMS